MSNSWGASRKNSQIMGRFAQEWLNWGASRKNGHLLSWGAWDRMVVKITH